MRSIAERRGVRQFVKFGFVGASGTLVNFLVAFALKHAFAPGMPGGAVFALGFMAGGVWNWYLNRVWTFRSSAHPVREAVQFLCVSAVALCAGELVFWARPFGNVDDHFLETWFAATLAGIVVNFFLNKYWTFKNAA